jgi:hypothetical protein
MHIKSNLNRSKTHLSALLGGMVLVNLFFSCDAVKHEKSDYRRLDRQAIEENSSTQQKDASAQDSNSPDEYPSEYKSSIGSDKKCEYRGIIYDDGESFPNDCNTCTCENGLAMCTKIACGSK